MRDDQTGPFKDVSEQLRSLLQKDKNQIDVLRSEIASQRQKIEMMRAALLQARTTIEALQKELSPPISKRLLAYIETTKGRLLGGSRPFTPRLARTKYVSHADLEDLILETVRIQQWDIEDVIVEISPGPGTNWRVCGIANGAVDMDLARTVVEEAAAQFTSYVLLGSELE